MQSLKVAIAQEHPRRFVQAWWTLLQTSKLTPLQITEMWNTSQTELESAILEFNNLSVDDPNYALTTRRVRIIDLTACIEVLADRL